MKLTKIILCIFTIVLYVQLSLGKSGVEHKEDMYRILGVNENQLQKDRLKATLDEFNKLIDKDYSSLYHDVQAKMKPYDFTWGTYTHRIFFHWGFNGDPRKFEPLKDRFNNAIYHTNIDSTDNSKAVVNFNEVTQGAYEIITAEHSRRNRVMLKKVGSLSPASRKHLNAVATIIYNVHILGDYSTSAKQGLISIEELKNDLIKHGIDNIDCPYALRNKLKQDINSAYRQHTWRKKQAEAILKVLEEQLPQCIEQSKSIKRIVQGSSSNKK